MNSRMYFRGIAPAALLVCAAAGAQTLGQTAPAAPQPPAPWTQAPGMPRLAEGWQAAAPARPTRAPRARVTAERTGVLSAENARRVKLDIDFGNITVRTDSPGVVRYRVHLEADGNDPSARALLNAYRVRQMDAPHAVVLSAKAPSQNGDENFFVSYEISVPRNLRVEISTGLGNVQVQDSNAPVQVSTGGGNITVGNVPEANLDTKGGHIVVGNVTGSLHANSGGGHITASNIGGDAVLITNGGHIHAGRIGGTAQLETGGGNISVDRASSRVTATSAAGQISFGEAAGAINAHTSGGGIRVLRVAGPMQLESQGGSILLTQVENEVHASTGSGSITAWFAPGQKLTNSSELAANQGDIQIYLPRSLAMTIDATVESPLHKIVADPAMKIAYVKSTVGPQSHAECKLNGGGEVLHLRTATGNIHLVYADNLLNQQDVVMAQQLRMQMAQFQDQINQIMKYAQAADSEQMREIARELAQQQAQMVHDVGGARMPMPMPVLAPAAPGSNGPGTYFYFTTTPTPAAQGEPSPAAPMTAPAMTPPPPQEDEPSAAQVWWLKLDQLWYGGVKQEPAEQQRRCISSPRPEYPSAAQQAGIQGSVELHVLVDKDGRVQEVWGVSGEQVLINAAIEAVRKWRYRPMLLDGKPVPVVTTVRLEFRLM